MGLRRFVFNLLAVSDYQSTPPSLLKKVGEEYGWYRIIGVEVNLPPDKQLVISHPEMVSRLIEEMPQLSSRSGGLIYGENLDFLQEIRKRNGMDLGTLWKQITAQCFDDTSSQLGYGEHQFRWSADINKDQSSPQKTVYSIFCFHSEQPPPEFFSLADLVTGYLNALIEGKPFDLSERLDGFVRHRKMPDESVQLAS